MASEGEVPIKVAKKDTVPTVHSNLQDLGQFKVEQVLNENPSTKTIFLQGTFEDLEGPAVVILEKKLFPKDKVQQYFSPDCSVSKIFVNDIYGNYESCSKDDLFTG